MKSRGKGRILYIDAMKGLSIFMVVLAHSLMNATKLMESEYAYAINLIAYLAVPSFFFINGYLYDHKYSKSPIKSIIKKFKAYYVPFVGFSLFFWLFHNVFVRLHLTYEPVYEFKDYVVRFVLVLLGHMESVLNGPMWFLRAIFITVSLYIVIDFFVMKIANKNIRLLIILLVSAFSCFLGKLQVLPQIYNINKAVYYLFVFCLGFVFKEYGLERTVEKYKAIIFPIGAAMIITTAYFIYGGIGTYRGFIDVFGQMGGIIAIFALAHFKMIQSNELILWLGKASLDIMSLHFLAFKLVTFILITIKHLDIERLAEYPVLVGTHGIESILYVIAGLGLCAAEYAIRNKVNNIIKKKYK